MTFHATAFDKLAYIDRLEDAGVEEKQARAQADASGAALRDSVATKAVIDLLRADIRADIANLKTGIARWVFGAAFAIVGFVVALEKLLR